jgi:hypothetical protein
VTSPTLTIGLEYVGVSVIFITLPDVGLASGGCVLDDASIAACTVRAAAVATCGSGAPADGMLQDERMIPIMTARAKDFFHETPLSADLILLFDILYGMGELSNGSAEEGEPY